jgi:uncharacterized lipoprotein
MSRSNDHGTRKVKKNIALVLAAIALLSLLGGCSYLRTKFGSKSDAYKNSSQARPLEVPPDLDAPNRSGALQIPEPGASTATVATDGSAPAPLVPPAAAPPMSAAASLGGDGLQVADTLANTWVRVGLALERSGIATIQARDEAARSYEIRATGQKTRRPGLLKRVVTLGMAGDKTVATPVNLRVVVSGSDGASKVTVQGAATESDTSAARQVLDTLRQRLN